MSFLKFPGNLLVGCRGAVGGIVPPGPGGHQVSLSPARLGDVDSWRPSG